MAATKKEPTATASAEDKAAIATLNAANETADAALTAANLKVASLEAAQTDLATKLSAFTAEKDASDKKAAGEATKAECSTLYKTSLNREPTDAELSSFTTYSAEARTAFGAALTATAKPALGDLGKETALEGQTVAKKSVLASAFERLDNHNVKK